MTSKLYQNLCNAYFHKCVNSIWRTNLPLIFVGFFDFLNAMGSNYKITKSACYTANISMAIVANISPILFITFNELYGISFSLLGLLVLINYFTQLSVDVIFSLFSHKFNIPIIVKATPLITVIGLLVYALSPFVFSNVYIGLVIGTIIFSASGGLSEVLISPLIASIPSDNPEREMSKLHSIYAWGVVIFVVFSSIYILVFGTSSWQWLSLIFAIVPLFSFVLFCAAKIPQMQETHQQAAAPQLSYFKSKDLWICVLAIFLGGAAECTMSQWCSGYLDAGLGLPKLWGDIFGVALFGLTLGLGRSLYAKFGKSITKMLLLGAIGAALCYLTAALTQSAIVGLFACALTGLCVSMLWPGSLIVASDRFPHGGVFIYAMMAAGGDLGASIGPQLTGLIADLPTKLAPLKSWAEALGLTPEQFGLRLGILSGMIFPLIAIFVYLYIMKSLVKRNEKA